MYFIRKKYRAVTKHKTHYLLKPFLYLLLFLFSIAGNWACQNTDAATTSTDKKKFTGAAPVSIIKQLKSRSLYADTARYRQFFFDNYNQAITKKEYEKAKDIVAAYGCITDGIYDTVYIATASQFINRSYPLVVDSQYAMICHFLGWNFFMEGNYPNVLKWSGQSLASCTFPNATKTKTYAYNDLAATYINTNKPDSAVTYFLAAEAIDESNKDTTSLAATLFNLGACYYALSAFGECAKYVTRSAELHRLQGDTSGYLQTLSFFPLEAKAFGLDTTATLDYINRVTEGYQKLYEKTAEDSFYQSFLLAQQSFLLQRYADAGMHLDVCKRISNTIVDPTLTAYLETLTPQYELARFGAISNEAEVAGYAKEMLQMGSIFSAADAYHTLAQNAEQTGELKNALHYHNLEQQLRDSIQKSNIKGQLFELDKKYGIEKKEQQIELQQKTILSRNTTIALLATSILGLVLAGVALQYRQRQKKLTQEKQNNLNYTRQLLEKTEEERKRIASDLHDSISHELLSLKTAVRMEDISVVNTKVDTIINDIRIISRNLHPVMFDKIGLQQSIEQLAERVQQQNQFMLTADIDYTAGTLPLASELQVYRMVQEAVTNIIRYAKAIAGKITIRQTTAAVQIEIKDNGNGFSVEETLNSGKAFGLHNLIERSRAIGGETKIVSGTGGTIITIHLSKS